jgi:hypothetical protein
MAVKSVSELNEVTTLNDDDLFMVSTKDGSGNYSSSNKLTYGSLKSIMPSGSGSGSPFFQLSSGYKLTELTVTIDRDSLLVCIVSRYSGSRTDCEFSINGISYMATTNKGDTTIANGYGFFDTTVFDEFGDGNFSCVDRYFLKRGDIVVFKDSISSSRARIYPIIYTESHQ